MYALCECLICVLFATMQERPAWPTNARERHIYIYVYILFFPPSVSLFLEQAFQCGDMLSPVFYSEFVLSWCVFRVPTWGRIRGAPFLVSLCFVFFLAVFLLCTHRRRNQRSTLFVSLFFSLTFFLSCAHRRRNQRSSRLRTCRFRGQWVMLLRVCLIMQRMCSLTVECVLLL